MGTKSQDKKTRAGPNCWLLCACGCVSKLRLQWAWGRHLIAFLLPVRPSPPGGGDPPLCWGDLPQRMQGQRRHRLPERGCRPRGRMQLEGAVMLGAPVAPKDRKHPGDARAKHGRCREAGGEGTQPPWLPLRACTLRPSPPAASGLGDYPNCSPLCCSPPMP